MSILPWFKDDTIMCYALELIFVSLCSAGSVLLSGGVLTAGGDSRGAARGACHGYDFHRVHPPWHGPHHGGCHAGRWRCGCRPCHCRCALRRSCMPLWRLFVHLFALRCYVIYVRRGGGFKVERRGTGTWVGACMGHLTGPVGSGVVGCAA